MKETTITNKILKYLNSLPNCKAEKRHGSIYSEIGAPDVSACYKGRRIEIEVKVPGKEPEKIQEVRLRQWKNAGAYTMCATSLGDVIHAIGIIDNYLL